MTAIFSFDEIDEHIPPRARRDTASSLNSFDDRWQQHTEHDSDDTLPTRIRHFGNTTTPWDTTAVIAEEDEFGFRTGTPPIPIPSTHSSSSGASQRQFGPGAGSVKVEFQEEFVAAQVASDGSLNRKMVPADFEQVKVLGKGGYGTVLLVRHKESGKLFAQKQLKKASLVVKTKIIGIIV